MVVYHPNCKASTDFLIAVSKLSEAEIEYINIKEDKVETSLDIDVVPLMIIDNNPDKIFRGKAAFDKIEELKLNKTVKSAKKQQSGNKYNKNVTFVEQADSKKEKIDISKR